MPCGLNRPNDNWLRRELPRCPPSTSCRGCTYPVPAAAASASLRQGERCDSHASKLPLQRSCCCCLGWRCCFSLLLRVRPLHLLLLLLLLVARLAPVPTKPTPTPCFEKPRIPHPPHPPASPTPSKHAAALHSVSPCTRTPTLRASPCARMSTALALARPAQTTRSTAQHTQLLDTSLQQDAHPLAGLQSHMSCG